MCCRMPLPRIFKDNIFSGGPVNEKVSHQSISAVDLDCWYGTASSGSQPTPITVLQRWNAGATARILELRDFHPIHQQQQVDPWLDGCVRGRRYRHCAACFSVNTELTKRKVEKHAGTDRWDFTSILVSTCLVWNTTIQGGDKNAVNTKDSERNTSFSAILEGIDAEPIHSSSFSLEKASPRRRRWK